MKTCVTVNYCSFLSSRKDLFTLINSLQTVHEAFVASDTYHRTCHLKKMVRFVYFFKDQNLQIETLMHEINTK